MNGLRMCDFWNKEDECFINFLKNISTIKNIMDKSCYRSLSLCPEFLEK